MAENTTTSLKTNPEAHVDLCAERYNRLETRLEVIENVQMRCPKDYFRTWKYDESANW